MPNSVTVKFFGMKEHPTTRIGMVGTLEPYTDWLKTRGIEHYIWTTTSYGWDRSAQFEFENADDAMLFRLTWG